MCLVAEVDAINQAFAVGVVQKNLISAGAELEVCMQRPVVCVIIIPIISPDQKITAGGNCGQRIIAGKPPFIAAVIHQVHASCIHRLGACIEDLYPVIVVAMLVFGVACGRVQGIAAVGRHELVDFERVFVSWLKSGYQVFVDEDLHVRGFGPDIYWLELNSVATDRHRSAISRRD